MAVSAGAYVYPWALLAHSYLRWAVLIAGVLALALALHGWRTGRAWGRADERLAAAFVGLADLQLLVGLLLHLWLSPFSGAALEAGVSTSLAYPPLWFFGYVHPLAMIAAVVVAHAARARGKRAADAAARFRIAATGLAVGLVVVVLAVPWPWLAYGRPLLRIP